MGDLFWIRVRDIFEAAAESPAAERSVLIRAMSKGDGDVVLAVEELLAADAGDFLSQPPFVSGAIATAPSRIAPGTRIGDYRVQRLVGRGGMGEVYEGIRALDDFEKRVAIKMVRAGISGAAAVSRFERERRILAQLDHPNIAALLDGGVMLDGTPYLVMEFVEGERITTWCDGRRLGLASRLALFRQVCDAVGYAHRHLIVHRDLKPGNIFVTGDGAVKLLDFGIAKVLADETGNEETETRPEARALTREYAAPEHLTDGLITTGTDVYALGLLLFELLTGRRPFAGRDLPFAEFVHLVTTRDAPLPSGVTPDPVRGVQNTRDRARLRGDLDAIVLRALRPSPRERYGTVDELVDDLNRFGDGRPVSAMRGRRLYRARKFARRNRGALLAAGAVMTVLAAGVAATVSQGRRADVQRNRAEATNAFLTEMLQAVDPAAQGRDVLMADVLDSAARRIATDPPHEADVEASLQGAIGASYVALGKYAAAEPHLSRALALRQQHPGEVLPLVNAIGAMASLFDARGEFPRADSLYRRALALLPASPDSAVSSRAADLTNQLARMQSQQGNYAGAIVLLHQALERQVKLFGPVADAVGRTTGDLGLTLMQKGDIASADSVERAAIAIVRATHPPARMLEGADLGRLATALDLEGKPASSDSAYRASLAILDPLLGPEHPDVTWIRYNYAGSLLAWGEAGRALAVANQVLSLRGKTLPETHPILPAVLIVKGQALGRLGDHPSAVRAIREALSLRQTYLAPGHWLVGSAESALGAELLAANSREEAVQLLASGCQIMTKALGPDHPKVKEALARLKQASPAANCD